jgi:hypothetical protein
MSGHFCSRGLVLAVLGPQLEEEVCGLRVVPGRGFALAEDWLLWPLEGMREG